MSVAGFAEVPLEIWSGLIDPSEMPAQNLPQGASWDCQDVKFIENGVQTRPGLASQFAALAGNPTVNYLRTFTDLSGNNRTLFLDGVGKLWQEYPEGTVTNLAAALAVGTIPRAKSTTLFGREYIAISDGKFGADLPRQFDTTNLDRVSQGGPGAPPTMADEGSAPAASTIAAAPTGAVRTGGIVTITLTAAASIFANESITVAGVTDASFNGTFTILTVSADKTKFTYAQTGSDATSGAGTATVSPTITAGLHKVAVCFQTRQGYITAPSPIGYYQASGTKRLNCTVIPTGPSNVTARIILMTAAGGSSYSYTAQMILDDNTTTSLVIDLSDTLLGSGTPADDLFRLVELGECAGVVEYSDRLFWWGERNKQNNWVNLGFDGGFTGPSLPHFPLGWTQDPTFAPGGAQASVQGDPIVWGDAYSIVGNGATATRGLITQRADVDANGVALISAKTSYSVRARVARNSALIAGTFHINLKSVSGAFTTAGLSVTAAQAGTSYAEFTAELIPSSQIAGAVPSDLVLQVYADGTPTNNGDFVVDSIEIYPTSTPYSLSLVRVSNSGDDPESYDGVNGILEPGKENGQRTTCVFKMRDTLYIAKERSLHSTSDDGVNPPSLWQTAEISNKIGSVSVQGVDVGEEWAVLANRDGLYIFAGSNPVKISKEIQPLWDSINWQYGHTVWVKIDAAQRRIYVGAPFGSATSPNKVLMLDYRGLDTWEDIATHWAVHFSSYSGKILAIGNSRKWAPWIITANCGALIERANGTQQMWMGNGAGTGKVYALSDTQFSDDGTAINSYYTTYYFPSHQEEQQMQIGSHRKLFGYLSLVVEGSGSLSVTAVLPGGSTTYSLASVTLASVAGQDAEQTTNVLTERMAYKVGTNAVGSWFRIRKFVPAMKLDPWSPVRGA